MDDVLSAVGGAVLLVGVAFVIVASIGIHRFDDVFARSHAAGKASSLGLLLVSLGAGLRLDDAGLVLKLVLVVVVAVITIPVGVHIVARAAYRAGTELSSRTSVDELADDERAGRGPQPD